MYRWLQLYTIIVYVYRGRNFNTLSSSEQHWLGGPKNVHSFHARLLNMDIELYTYRSAQGRTYRCDEPIRQRLPEEVALGSRRVDIRKPVSPFLHFKVIGFWMDCPGTCHRNTHPDFIAQAI